MITKNQKVIEHLSCSAKEIDHEDDIGISIVVPEDSLPPDESVDLVIQPCLSGPFEMPEDIKPASPAYLIETKKKVELKKSLIVRIQHCANLQTEEDCKDMVFLQANSYPVHRPGSKPVYIFKKVDGVEGRFTAGESQVGEIELTQFSFLGIGRKSTGILIIMFSCGLLKLYSYNIIGSSLYSARLYKASSTAYIKAVFCMCPDLKCCIKVFYVI